MDSHNQSMRQNVQVESQGEKHHVQLGAPKRFHRGVALDLGFERWKGLRNGNRRILG